MNLALNAPTLSLLLDVDLVDWCQASFIYRYRYIHVIHEAYVHLLCHLPSAKHSGSDHVLSIACNEKYANAYIHLVCSSLDRMHSLSWLCRIWVNISSKHPPVINIVRGRVWLWLGLSLILPCKYALMQWKKNGMEFMK